jgi:hypothetical protein
VLRPYGAEDVDEAIEPEDDWPGHDLGGEG